MKYFSSRIKNTKNIIINEKCPAKEERLFSVLEKIAMRLSEFRNSFLGKKLPIGDSKNIWIIRVRHNLRNIEFKNNPEKVKNSKNCYEHK